MPSIPITNVAPYIQYTAIASQTAFSVPFVFFYDSVSYPNPLRVYLTPTGHEPSDVDDILVLNVDYTISQNINYTGTVTLTTGATAGDIITIVRAMNNVRLNYYIDGGAFTANAVNTDFESEVLYIQQNTYAVQNLAPHYNYSATIGIGDIILPKLGENEVWIKDPTDTFITTTTLPGSGPSPSFLQWQIITTSQQITPGIGFIVDTVSPVTITFESSFEVGDTFAVILAEAGNVTLDLGAGQTLLTLAGVSSSGGTLNTTQQGMSLTLVAISSTRLHLFNCVTSGFTIT